MGGSTQTVEDTEAFLNLVEANHAQIRLFTVA